MLRAAEARQMVGLVLRQVRSVWSFEVRARYRVRARGDDDVPIPTTLDRELLTTRMLTSHPMSRLENEPYGNCL